MNEQFAMNRRCLVAASAAMLLTGPALAARDEVEVYKNPNCGCCTRWIAHLRASGFEIETINADDVTMTRKEFGVPPALGACHTARVGGYLIEGHVPARDILRLLRERPSAAGLAVPGMPRGSPGMEAAVEEPYDVLLFQANGRYAVFQRYGAR